LCLDPKKERNYKNTGKRGRKMRKAGHVSLGEMRGEYRISVRISAGKRSLGRPRHKWGRY
jgi:hypothetical protein